MYYIYPYSVYFTYTVYITLYIIRYIYSSWPGNTILYFIYTIYIYTILYTLYIICIYFIWTVSDPPTAKKRATTISIFPTPPTCCSSFCFKNNYFFFQREFQILWQYPGHPWDALLGPFLAHYRPKGEAKTKSKTNWELLIHGQFHW